MWFQYDGVQPHFSIYVVTILKATFWAGWIGRGGLIPWPPRSPDLSSLNYFSWEHLKNLVYASPLDLDEDLIARISEAAAHVCEIFGFQEYYEEDVETLIACDAEDCGFQTLNEDEIVTSVQEESDPVDDETDEDENNNNESSKGPSNTDVFSLIEIAMEWNKQQSECCSTQLLLIKRIRYLAMKK
ncbi:uncharacterized protein TNCV_2781951 [Trichonephila clavipes]|nr:uncharacterized protein TNCV_2781951 [Trichonephila clavipes]